MDKPQSSERPFADRHDVIQTVCVWKNGTCFRIEIIKRCEKPEELSYAALLWVEEEHGGKRMLVHDITFPWVHHESPEAALEHAFEALAAKIRYVSAGESEV